VAQQEGLSQADLRARAAAGGGGTAADAGSSSSFRGAAAPSMGRSVQYDQGKHAADTSFWVVHNTPEAKQRVDKPDGVVRCPMTNEPLRLKAMTAVVFTPADEGDEHDQLVAKSANERYICPLTKKALSNVNPVTVLRPSGMAISSVCVSDFIRKDMLDPFTDPPTKLKEKDIIVLRVEGTGFASRTKEAQLKVTTASSSYAF